MINKCYIILIVVLLPLLLSAQNETDKQTWYKGWNVGATGGINYFGTELKKDFSKVSMDMDSNPNVAFNVHIDKKFKSNFGLGFELEKSYYAGAKTFPQRINWLMYSDRFNTSDAHFVPNPIYFKTNLSSFFVNLTYNFPNIRNLNPKYRNLNTYLKAGFGFSSIGVELGYKDASSYTESNLTDPLYEKGQGIQSIRDMYATLHFGYGFNYFFTPRISLSAELTALVVSNDYLDGIQNYESTIVSDNKIVINRMPVYGLVGEFKVGISYYFNWYKKFLINSAWELKKEDFNNDLFYGSSSDSSK